MPSPAQPHVLILDSVPATLNWLTVALERQGHVPSRTSRAENLLSALGNVAPPDLLVVRSAAPPRSVLELLRRIRNVSPVPCIIVAGASDDLVERISALELGADDYLPRAMSQAEVLARVYAVLRRARAGAARLPLVPRSATSATPIAASLPGGWRLLPQRRALMAPDGLPVRLTGAEFELMRLLVGAGGEPVEREVISRTVFRRPWRVEDRAVDGLVKRLRRKLTDNAIATVRGVGYALLQATSEEPVANSPVMQPKVEKCVR
jgi:two-component system, OmpR family, response regulator